MTSISVHHGPSNYKHLPDSSKKIVKKSKNASVNNHGIIESIRENFHNVKLSVSSYDTAWVAMVPSNRSPNKPFFPESLDWIMQNQRNDGSWGQFLHSTYESELLKDSISSTLACILALRKWQVGEQLVHKGLEYIGSNNLAIHDKKLASPIGFDLVFPGMIHQAQKMGLNLPLDSGSMDHMLRNYELHLNSFRGNTGSLAYIAEGFGESYKWNDVLVKHQRRNGSLFNSPATTAAALLHTNDDKCYNYLHTVLQTCGNTVPVMYPFNMYTRLCLVDTIESLGIDRYFTDEITNVLDETYRSWNQKSEDMFLDVDCHAMAFRLLRMRGYDIQSDTLAEYVEQEKFFNTVSLQFKNTSTILELYKASQIQIYEHEQVLERIMDWTCTFLKNQSINKDISNKRLMKKVGKELSYSITETLDRLAHRKNIELYDPDEYQLQKTSYRCYSIHNMDILKFATQDFNKCQAIHREELEELERWAKDFRLDDLNYDHHILISSYFQYAAVHFTPEFSHARISWGKNSTVGTIIDDIFDCDGTREELRNIIELFEKWDERSTMDLCSKRIEILLPVLEETVNDMTAKALKQHGRNIRDDVVKMWLTLVQAMWKEVEWWTKNVRVSLDEYGSHGTYACGIALFINPVYFFGQELSKEILESEELWTLYNLLGKIQRLQNDYQSDEREFDHERNLNACKIVENESNGAITYDEARMKVRGIVERNKREVLRMKIQEKGSIVPKVMKDTFWKLIKVIYYLYTKGDEYRRPGSTKEDIKVVLYEPIPLPNENASSM